MPTYIFECPRCYAEREIFQTRVIEQAPDCEICGEMMTKKIVGIAFHYHNHYERNRQDAIEKRKI